MRKSSKLRREQKATVCHTKSMSTEGNYRVAVLGSGGVGKTCVVLRLTRQSFDPEYVPTIQDYFEKKLVLDNQEYTLNIIDTAGQDEMQGITDIAIQDANAFVIIYSVTSLMSFNEAEKYRDKVVQFSQGAVPKIVLVGNKCDMETERAVTTVQGKQLADKWGCPFFEASAKNDINITQVFEASLRALLGKIGGGKDGEGGCCNVA